MPKFLILGGMGLIGSRITNKLIAQEHEVVIYDKFFNFIESEKLDYVRFLKNRHDLVSNKATLVYGDVRDYANLSKTILEHRPEIIIHLAQIPLANISNQISSEALDININGMTALIKAIGSVDFVKRLVYSSSSFVYGHFQYAPADENHPTNPIDVYGGTKLAGESIIKGFCTRFGIEYTIIRPSAVYGPTDCNKRVSEIFIEAAFNNNELTLDGGGINRQDFTFVDDAANGFVLAALSDKAKNEIFNITRGEGRSLLEFVEILKKYFPNIKTIVKPADINRPVRGALSIAKARDLLGYEPKYSLEDGIKEYYDFLKEHKYNSSI